MSDCNTITQVLLRSGESQANRDNTDLRPDKLILHGFGISEWMAFAYNFATHVNFFEVDNIQIPEGNWQEFFKDDLETVALLKQLEDSDELTPHLTLFICFIRLLEMSKDRLNGITKRHLDYYYSEILQIDKLPAQFDKVNILFELSKNISMHTLEAGTLLNAGKDANGNPLIYQLTEEFTANQAQVEEIRNFYFDLDYVNPTSGDTEEKYYVKAGAVAKSTDGLGDKLPEDTSWYGFGYNHQRVDAPFTQIENAKLGFAVSSKVLSLLEGERHIRFDIEFNENIDTILPSELVDNISVAYTSAEEWIEGVNLLPTESVPSGADPLVLNFETSSNQANKLVSLYVKIPSGSPASVNYDAEIHLGQYETQHPLFRFIVDPNSEAGNLVYKNFIKKIKKIDISVEVQRFKSLILDSDTGSLNPEKPMYPFTATPVKGSSFRLYHEEIFSKKWDNLRVNVIWKNTPDDFFDWYQAFSEIITSYKSGYPQSVIVNSVPGNHHFKAIKSINSNDEWIQNPSLIGLFTQEVGSDIFETNFTYSGSVFNTTSVSGVKLSLNQSFLHEVYPRLYAQAISNKYAVVPNQPYTPYAESIIVSYTATDTIALNTATVDSFNSKKNAFFHEHPFGMSLEHPFLKTKLSPASPSCSLVPVHCRGGEMYIGLSNADHLQNVSLLIQVLEGSENKTIPTFEGEQKVHWEILCENQWMELDSTLLIRNEIDNFLHSGIVTFKIPNEASNTNTSLPSGLFWVRAKMHKAFDTICQIIDINAQATAAEFVDNSNELSHLLTGLPAETIAKLKQRKSEIKKVSQPFNSFDGKAEEKDVSYYRRVSERLRHKHRSVTLWDYEHMVLQQFQDIYKVKCLNHTSENSFTAAGDVTLVVIPDTVNKNVFNIYQPRVSTALLNQIETYISQFTSLHVRVDAINPFYEEIMVSLKVKFYAGLDESVHIIKLNEDLIRFMSPWAFDTSVNVDFGAALHRSVLIEYIENLPYVDYIQDIVMSMNGGPSIKNYTPSSPKAIMVSAEQHSISTDIITCDKTTNQIITDQCQL